MNRTLLASALLLLALPIQLAGQSRASEDGRPLVSSFAAAFESAAEGTPVPTVLANPSSAITVVQPQLRSGKGRTYMIAGAAALVGGLLVGGDVGNIIAAGGVVLGVYGITLYY